MDKLLTKELDKEHYDELLNIVKERYNVTPEQIIDSCNQEEVSDDMYRALDMLMIDPMKWLNLKFLRKDPMLDINFVKELKKYTCQFEKKCKDTNDAAIIGHLECLKYLHENGCAWDEWTFIHAAENGHLECIKHLHENKCPWNKSTYLYAAKNDHLECLKYLHENGCPQDNSICEYVAGYGHLECLKYLHEKGCYWDGTTLYYAAENGHLDCLKYAHTMGCPWNEYICNITVTNGDLECLKYAIENGCPYDKNHCIKLAKKYKKSDCLTYLESL